MFWNFRGENAPNAPLLVTRRIKAERTGWWWNDAEPQQFLLTSKSVYCCHDRGHHVCNEQQISSYSRTWKTQWPRSAATFIYSTGNLICASVISRERMVCIRWGRNQLLAISLAITLPVNSFRSSLVHHFLASVDAINEALEPSPSQTFANQSSACKKRLNVSTDHPEMNVKSNEVFASKAVKH